MQWIQKATQVGFWCDWEDGDGAVLMIGGGGKDCQRADHGIAITEADKVGERENMILVMGGPAQEARPTL